MNNCKCFLLHLILILACATATEKTQAQVCESPGSCPQPSNETTLPRSKHTIRTHYLFVTPLVKTNLAAFVSNLTQFNTNLSNHILSDYADFLSSTATNATEDAETTNHSFFEYQTENDSIDASNMKYRSSDEFAVLEAVLHKVATHMIEDVIKSSAVAADEDEDDAEDDKRIVLDFQSWAAVHYEQGSHGMHFHEDSSISAVYYVQVPPNSGRITFYDPRGPRPPFENELDVSPKDGDLLIFPSWLAHSVGVTGATDRPRISIPFNCDGTWTQTNAVRTESVVEVESIESP